MSVCFGLKVAESGLRFTFLFFFPCTVSALGGQEYCSHPVKYCLYTVWHCLQVKNIKNKSTILFTHLKIILLECFQFSVSATISSIQTDPESWFYYLVFAIMYLISLSYLPFFPIRLEAERILKLCCLV